MEQPISPTPHGTSFLRVVTLLVFALLIAIVSSLLTFIFLNKQNQQPITITPKPTVTIPTASPSSAIQPTAAPSANPTLYPTSNNPLLKRFTSDKLGITFTYLTKQNEETLNTLESGDKVYIYSNNFKDPTQGQWVEVFSKDPTQSLENTIKEKFLKNISSTDCFTKVLDTAPIAKQNYPANFKLVEISYNRSDDPNLGPDAGSEKCPATYTSTNGISYFLEDRNYPSKYLYLSIGQYAILSENDKVWQNTLQVLK